MSPTGSVSHWIGQVKKGDAAAAQHLWEGYFRRLVGLARKKLQTANRRVADEEDVAQEAFASFWKGAARGQFPQLRDRNDLWRLLMVITARKAVDQRARQTRKKRGGGRVAGESAFFDPEAPEARGIENVVGAEPTPEFAALVAEQCRLLLTRLADRQLRQIAVWKMEGCTNEDIARRLDCSIPTIERRLGLIRKLWQDGLDH